MKNLLLLLLLFSSSVFATDIVLTSGHHNVVELNNKTLIINGDVSIGNINMNGNSKIIINSGKKLTLSSSLHLNGNDEVINNGILIVNNLELQNHNNYFENNGRFEGNEGQINDNSSWIKNCGEMHFNGNFNLNSTKEGSVYLCDCSLFKTKGLHVNSYKPFKGKGSVWVTDNMNLNNYVGIGIIFVWNKDLKNQEPQWLQYVQHDRFYSICSLPIIYTSVVVTKNSISFEVAEPQKIKKVIIQTSKDGEVYETKKEIIITSQTKYSYVTGQ